MSFDLAIWHQNGPISSIAAQERYKRICSGSFESEQASEISAFVTELTNLFPQIDDVNEDELDECPWTDEFDLSGSHCILNIRWGMQDELLPIVLKLARKHGLLMFDPQSGKVYDCPQLGEQ